MRRQAAGGEDVRWVDFDFAVLEHEAHSERMTPDEQTEAPNLRLWNGRAHCLCIELKD